MAGDRLMRAALSLAARGMPVFPLRPGTKRPAVRRDWEGCATTDVEQIERWWARAPYNVGIATGPAGLVVVDLDAPHGARGGAHGWQALAALAREAGAAVPRGTFAVVTPHGGQHLYFRAPESPRLTNTAGRLGPLIDTRAVGGYVVGPGSRVERRAYLVVNDVEPAQLPFWLLAALRPRVPVQPATAVVARSGYANAALADEVRNVESAGPGCRNVTLFSAAAKLARFTDSGHLTVAEIRSSLTRAATRHVGVEGFTETEATRTIESGLRRGRSAEVPREPTIPGQRRGPNAARSSSVGLRPATRLA